MAEGGEDKRSAAISDATTTAVAIGDLVAVQNTGFGATAEADFDKIWTEHDKVITDILSNKTAINSIILALEKAGIIADN